ncbi:MAG TPA: twin-arginine translocation signal domain-containing protein [Xanthobacteraceae bacterium]|nr:twin-arginine translocation signal domain-containing protein [Xanthobacteraceae bacterium]
MDKPENKTVARRDFLRVLATGAGAAAAASAAPLTSPAAVAESDQEKRKARYKETEHVKAFYRVNKYPQ